MRKNWIFIIFSTDYNSLDLKIHAAPLVWQKRSIKAKKVTTRPDHRKLQVHSTQGLIETLGSMVIFDGNQAVSDINKYEFLNTIYVQIVNFLVIWYHFDYFLWTWVVRKPIKINEKTVCEHANSTVFGIAVFYPPLF